MAWKTLADPPPDWQQTVREKKARFLVDESLGVGVADLLRGAGWNAVFAGDLGLLGHADEDIFAAAKREDRILLTHDRDFLSDRAFPPHLNPGIVVLPGGEGQEATLIRALGAVVSVVGRFRESWRGTKVVVCEDETWLVSSRSDDGRIHQSKYRFPKHGQVEIWEDVDDR